MLKRPFPRSRKRWTRLRKPSPSLIKHPMFKAQVSMLGVEPLKQVAGWYIDTAEDFASYGFVLQETGMRWTKDTPWAYLFGIQASIARKLIENSTKMTRTLWQIPQSLHSRDVV